VGTLDTDRYGNSRTKNQQKTTLPMVNIDHTLYKFRKCHKD